MEEKLKKCECGDECNCNECECDSNNGCNDECNCHDHDCNCESEPLIIEMEDLNGEKVKVEIIGTFDDNGKSYAIVNDLDNKDNSYIFEVQTTDEGDMLVSIDDEEEFDRLCKVVEKLVA